MNGTSSDNSGNMVSGPNLTGSFLGKLDNITVGGLGFSLPLNNPQISIWVPDITNFEYNSEPYSSSTNKEGLFITYPSLGNLQDLSSLSFSQIIQALKVIADNLSKLSAFSFLNERLPLIDLSINDMISYAAKFASLIDGLGNSGSQSFQETVANLKIQIDQLFHLDPNVLSISLDTNGIMPTDLATSASDPSKTTINPNGDDNGMIFQATGSGAAYQKSISRLVGSADVSDQSAQASWDADAKVLLIKINPGQTTAQAIIDAVNGIAGTPWIASKVEMDKHKTGSNSGAGTITTSAIKFHFSFSTAYGNSLPFELDLKKLVDALGGTSPAVAALLQAATTLIQVQGSGNLTVSASAALTLDFGLDLTNPSTIRPFFYDTTGIDLTARVAGTNISIQASLGAVAGIFIKNGTLTLDADGDPATGPSGSPAKRGGPPTQPDKGAVFSLHLRDNNGDGRHYFDENLFDTDNIDLHMQGGVSAVLPIFAPLEGLPLGGTADTNHDGYPDNDLVVDIPDLIRFFVDPRARNGVADVRIPGAFNDLEITRPVAAPHGDVPDNFKVVLQEGGSVGAAFSGDTLTVTLTSGMTTAQQIQSAVQNINLTGGAHFAVSFLSPDNPDPMTANTGAGVATVSKLTLITPDFSKLFDGLDLCAILSSATGPLLDGLDKLLGSIQDGLNAVVLNVRLPLVGDGLAGIAHFIQDFRNGLLAELRQDVKDANGHGLAALANAIKKAFLNSLGPGGLNLLVDPKTGNALDNALGYSQLDVTLDCDKGLAVHLRLKKEISLIDTTGSPLKFDIGVPGFELKATGNLKVALGFDLKFGFGVNKEDGFFFESSAPASAPELQIYFKVTLPGVHFTGQLLFLQLDIADDAAPPSSFLGQFSDDLRDPTNHGILTCAEMNTSLSRISIIITAQLSADAKVNLDLAASFGGDTAFPRVLAQFHLRWHFDLNNGAGEPEIYFYHVGLDLGTFISNFLAPVLSEIHT